MTVTESKKCFDENGKPFFEKHKIYVYDEDFDVFMEGMEQMINYILLVKSESQVTYEHEEHTVHLREPEPALESYADIDFDDLGNR